MNTQPCSTSPSPAAPQAAPDALSHPWKRQPLPPRQAVQVLDFRAGEIALLEVEEGRVWVTCDGLLEDYFLEAGQRLSFTGPARLRVSAEGPRAACLLWARHPIKPGVAYPPAAPPTAQPLTVVPTAAAAASPRLPHGAISAA